MSLNNDEIEKDTVSPATDLDDEGFIKAPPVLITSDDLIKAAEVDTFLSPSYKRCSKCALRHASPPCEFFEAGAVCQIERNLFREYLKDLQRQGVDITDRILVMVGFIHLVSIWRAHAIEASRNEDIIHSTKEGAELSKYR
ncbi:MAG: hypothetical protein ACTSRU_19405, partial [Candidatus Hodarchaeales archaeon]